MNVLQPKSEPRLVSIVIPCFNESEAIDSLRRAMDEFVGTLDVPLEIVLVDDGSTDATWEMLSQWQSTKYQVVALRFSRNFGHQLAVTAGLDRAQGDAVVIMDADLQDPPDVIPRMLKAYRMGYDVVHGQRLNRDGETRFKKWSAWVFYRFMKLAGATHMTLDSGDFRLVSRRCLDEVIRMREQKRFLRGLFSWVGFAQTSVSYRRPPRTEGTTKYSLRKMCRLAWTALVSFSVLPLRMASAAGLITACGGGLYAAYAICRWAFFGDTVRGWATLVILISGIGGMVLLCLGILGEYIARIYEELRQRPLYIIQDETNTSPHRSSQRDARQGIAFPRQLGTSHRYPQHQSPGGI